MKILFLCTGNAARSQIAEAVARAEALPGIEVCSAGTHPAHAVHDTARAVLEEAGLWEDRQHPKGLSDLPHTEWDFVIAVCAYADQTCPTLPGEHQRLRWPFDDPSAIPDEGQRLAAFRQLRDTLRARIRDLFATLPLTPSSD